MEGFMDAFSATLFGLEGKTILNVATVVYHAPEGKHEAILNFTDGTSAKFGVRVVGEMPTLEMWIASPDGEKEVV
jgi:hypothetical protein